MKIKTEKIWNESQEEIKQALKKYMQYAEELMSMEQTKKLDATFQLNINIKSGIKWYDWVGLGVSIITAVIFPIMWIPAIISIGKMIWSLVSTDYKMSQQREAAEKEIKKAVEQIKQEIGKNIIAMNQPLEQVAAVIKSETAKTITHIEIFIGNMHAAQVKFEAIVAGIEQISK
jgi:hypothetical protein